MDRRQISTLQTLVLREIEELKEEYHKTSSKAVKDAVTDRNGHLTNIFRELSQMMEESESDKALNLGLEDVDE